MTNHKEREEKVNLAIEIAIKVGLLALVIYISYLIAKPFIAVVVWGVIIAVAISPVINSLEKRFGNKKKVIIAFVATAVIGLLVPTFMLSGSVIHSAQTLSHAVKEGNITIPPSNDKVKEWPVIGEKAYAFWNRASHNLKATLKPFEEDILKGIKKFASSLGAGLGTILMFVASLVIAAAFLIGSKESIKLYEDILRRLVGDKSEEWATLSALTIRSVVMGVLGVAVIQSFFALIGMVVMGIPLAIVWAIAIMFLTIIQVPTIVIIGPMIAYVFSQGSGTAEIVFTIYMLIVGASDGIMKPMLMGRGVDIPMLVILIGAIGGMILMGMVGLFLGAVVFALAYKLFGLWISDVQDEVVVEKN